MTAYPRKWRLWLGLAALSLASAWVEGISVPGEPSYRAATTTTYPDLRTAAESTHDLNMLQNLAGSVKGVEALFDRSKPFTVFAPRNSAFDRYPRSLLNEIWVPGNKLWPKIFWHHIVAGRFGPENLTDGTQLKAFDGTSLRIERQDGTLLVEGVPILGTLFTRTSVIYVVDSLLLPEPVMQEIARRL